MGGHVGGYFSVPPRTVWFCCFLLISRIPVWVSPVWDRVWVTTCHTACWSFALLVIALGHGPVRSYILTMQPTPAHTRTRTLRERLGVDQDGSTSVRFTGRLAEERLPVHRHGGVDEDEDDYFKGLRSPEITTNDDFCDNDYELGDDNDADKIPVTGPSAELPLGDDSFQAFLSEQRGYPSMDPDAIRKFTSRLPETKPVKEMATPIDSTRRGLPQIFRLDGQTEATQAHGETKRGEVEKDFTFESLARDYSTSWMR